MDYKGYSKSEVKLIKVLASVCSIYGIDCDPVRHLDIPMRSVIKRYVYLVLPKLSDDLYSIALRDAHAGLSASDSTDRVGRATLSRMIKDVSRLL